MRRVAAAAAAALACVAAEASAYTTMTSPASRWPRTRMPIPWYIHEAGSADLGIDVSERETRASFDNWQNVGCAYITFGFQGRTSQRAESSRGMNVMSWTESGWRYESYALAVTQNWFGRGTIEESDIECNGATATWNTTGGRGIDLQSVMTHEVGHLLGLGHTTVRGATMYASYSGGTAERSLEADDIEGVCFLYPDDSGGCTTDGDCPTGYRCSGGSCVPNPTGDGLMCAPCSSAADCREGLCLSGFPDGGTYCGKNCTSDAQCGTGNRCWPVSGGSSQCAPADGDCTPEPTGCATDLDCPTGQRCEPPNCVPVTPRPDCTVDSDCSAGLVCRDGRCVTPPDPGLRGFGEPCGDGSQCQTGLCMDGYCTRSCPPHQPLGTCPDGYYCDDLSCGEGRCRRGGPGAGAVGTPCSQDADCDTAHCETAGGVFTCLAPCNPQTAISSCPEGSRCQPGATAGCGVCMCGGGLFGDPCAIDSDCFFGECRAPEGEALRCTTGCHSQAGVSGGLCPSGADCLTVAGPDGTPLQRCVATGTRLGAGCRSWEDCQSGICAVNDGTLFCSRTCTSTCTCPRGMGCSNGFCTPSWLMEEGCGCRAAGATRSGAWASLALLALAGSRSGRRRGKRSPQRTQRGAEDEHR